MSKLTDEEAERIIEARHNMEKTKEIQAIKSNTKKGEDDKTTCGKWTKGIGIFLTTFFSCYMLIHAILTISGWLRGDVYRAGELVLAKVLTWIFTGVIDSPIAIGVMAYVFGTALVVVCLVFSTKIIAAASKNLEKFYKYSSYMITYCAFFLIWLISPITMVIEENFSPIGFATIVGILFCIAMIIWELLKAKKEYLDREGEDVARTTNTKSVKAKSVDNIQQELAKLKKMKDDGLITDEEFATLKAKIINK